MVTNLIQLGDKVDICPLPRTEQIAQEERSGIGYRIYKSQVNDITDDGELEIAMPIENGKVILLPLGMRFQFVFYISGGLCYSVGQIKERYKKDNIFMLLIELHSQLKKLQRREYYRCPCTIDLQFYQISERDARMMPTEAVFKRLKEDAAFYNSQKQATILDLSGGGVRFVGKDKLEQDSYLLMIFRLTNLSIDKQYVLKAHVLASYAAEKRHGLIETRVQFLFQDDRTREEIIRFIFEEERKTRGRR